MPPERLTLAGRYLLASGIVGLAAVCMVNGSFAFERQPVPKSWPAQEALVWLSAISHGCAGLALLPGRWTRVAAAFLAGTLAVWTVALHLPRIVQGVPVAWLAAAECLAVAAGAAVLAMPDRPTIGRGATGVFALCLMAFGAAHFIYADFTAQLVPGWMPARLFWAYATGAAHIAAGLAISTGMLDRLAALLLTAMMALFTLLVNLPAALGAPDFGREAAHLCFALAMTASAALIAGHLAGTPDQNAAP